MGSTFEKIRCKLTFISSFAFVLNSISGRVLGLRSTTDPLFQIEKVSGIQNWFITISNHLLIFDHLSKIFFKCVFFKLQRFLIKWNLWMAVRMLLFFGFVCVLCFVAFLSTPAKWCTYIHTYIHTGRQEVWLRFPLIFVK